MKIKKTLLPRELEFTPQEIEKIFIAFPAAPRYGLFSWIKETFGLNLMPNKKGKNDK